MSNTDKKFGALSSSVDGAKLANTVKSVVLGLSSVILLVATHYGFTITDTQIAEFASQAGLAISSIWFIFGVVQKGVVAVIGKYRN